MTQKCLPVPAELNPPTFVFCLAQPHAIKSDNYEDYFIKYMNNKTNWQPYFLDRVLYARDPVLMDTVELDFPHMTFRPVLVDYTRFGICFALDSTWMINEREQNNDLLVVDLIVLFHSQQPDDLKVYLIFFLS